MDDDPGAVGPLRVVAPLLPLAVAPVPARARLERAIEFGPLGAFGRDDSAGPWMTMASDLVNPLLVGRLVGPSGVASVAIAARSIEQLGAVKQATMRLATPALGARPVRP